MKVAIRTAKHILFLGGGTLYNETTGDYGYAVAISKCKKRGKMVLLLPSRFDFKNRKVLYERESQRSYAITKKMSSQAYDQRIGFYKKIADLTVHGTNASIVVNKIIDTYKLRQVGNSMFS